MAKRHPWSHARVDFQGETGNPTENRPDLRHLHLTPSSPTDSAETVLAFFSYATKDWDAPVEGPQVREIVTGLEAQAHAEMDNESLTLWRDQERLRWGDAWEAKLHRVIGKAHLFIALVSPAWLNSEYCQMEYAAFKTRAAALGGAGRVLPILLREVDEDHLRDLSEDRRACFAELKAIQMQLWSDIPLLDNSNVPTLLKTAATGIRARLVELRRPSMARCFSKSWASRSPPASPGAHRKRQPGFCHRV